MVEHVLIPVENNRDRMLELAEHAQPIVEALSARVTLYHVYTKSEYASLLDDMGVDSMDPNVMAKRNETVQDVAGVFHDDGASVTVRGDTGDPATRIVEYIQKHDVDHVFMGGRKKSPTQKALLGSISQQVLLSVDIPCTITMD